MLLITLTPHTKLSREAETYFPDLLPLKRNSPTSERGVLLDWICLPSLPLSDPDRNQERERKRNMEGESSLALPDAHLPSRRERRKSQRGQGIEIIPPFSPPRFSSLFCSPAWQIYRHKLQSSGKANSLWLPDPRAPWRMAKWAKSWKIPFAEVNHDEENTQANQSFTTRRCHTLWVAVLF